MENLKKIEGIDRYLLIAATLIFEISRRSSCTSSRSWPVGWIWGVIAALIFGFILNAAFDVRIFGPRMGMKAIVLLFPELVPGIGAISFLSVAMFVITHFHNKHVDAQEAGEEAV